VGSIFIKSLDAKDLESKFSTEDKLQYYEQSKYSLDDIKPYLSMLPPKEADLILMYYTLKKDQKEIAKILNLSQGGVSHRIARARERLSFIISIPKFSKTEMMEDLQGVLDEEIDFTIMWEIYRTTCQSQVAEIVGMTQSRVRHKYMKNLKILEEKSKVEENLKVYFDAFSQIAKNFNILHEISLPKWEHKNKDYRDIKKRSKNVSYAAKPTKRKKKKR
jgi:predicted XRE-type DNA-binding protein